MIYKFGEIVILKFPFTDESETKKRPALVLFDSADNDLILCRITTQNYICEFDIIINDWAKSGLLGSSVVRLHKIASIDKLLVYKKLGKLSRSDLSKVKNKIIDIINKIKE